MHPLPLALWPTLATVDWLQAAQAQLLPDLLAESSVGPTTLLITDQSPECQAAIEQLATQHDCSLKYATAVDGVGLRSLPPKVVLVVGPPGAGKSTLCETLERALGQQAKWVSASMPACCLHESSTILCTKAKHCGQGSHSTVLPA